ncbi:hypothetical protein [Sporosarcina sp. P33]|nr:hypothetical protein [Sporosarcina sp. P33]PID18700.1 hypothetical protein CSV62_07565 [Sporosarcina sp. P35]
MKEKNSNSDKYTVAGTNIEEVKKQNANSGLTYNEIYEVLAKKIESGSELDHK